MIEEVGDVSPRAVSPRTDNMQTNESAASNRMDTLEVELADSKSPRSKRIDHARTITDEVPFELKSTPMKVFHVILLGASILSPILLISTFVYATYNCGNTISCCSISVSIAYHDTYNTVITASVISCVLACFISCARQIQIRIKFIEYGVSTGWIRMNRASLFCNIAGYICIVLLTIFDTVRYNKIHLLFAAMAFTFCGLFGIITAFLTFKQRNIEYKGYLNKYKQNKKLALQRTFYLDAVLLSLLMWMDAIFILTYVAAFFYVDIYVSDDPKETPDLLPDWANVSEWMSFFSITATLMVLPVAFHHDNVDDELVKYIKFCCKR